MIAIQTRGRCLMFGAAKAGRRIVAGALIASALLLRASASNALDSVTFITDYGYTGVHAYFFEALDRGYYMTAGLEVKIVRGNRSAVTIRLVGDGNAMFVFAHTGFVFLPRPYSHSPDNISSIHHPQQPHPL